MSFLAGIYCKLLSDHTLQVKRAQWPRGSGRDGGEGHPFLTGLFLQPMGRLYLIGQL